MNRIVYIYYLLLLILFLSLLIDIFQSILDYKNRNIRPKVFNLTLESFIKFRNEKWKIPSKIEYWDILYENVIPSYFSKNLYTLDDQYNKSFFYNNFNFLNSDDLTREVVNNNNFKSTEQNLEVLRFLGEE